MYDIIKRLEVCIAEFLVASTIVAHDLKSR